MSREDIEEAIEVLEDASAEMLAETGDENYYSEAIAILRQALETEQEPVLWLKTWSDGYLSVLKTKSHVFADHELEPLYTAPPKREWVGLTDQEVMVAAYQAGFDIHEDYENEDDPEAMHWWTPDGEACDDSLLKLRDLIEAKLKERNG
jgi:hypothetical protein